MQIDTSSDDFPTYITRDELLSVGFKSGEKFYCRAYVGEYTAPTINYVDFKTGKLIYTAFANESRVKTFIVP